LNAYASGRPTAKATAGLRATLIAAIAAQSLLSRRPKRATLF
jgi:hypothetical protein